MAAKDHDHDGEIERRGGEDDRAAPAEAEAEVGEGEGGGGGGGVSGESSPEKIPDESSRPGGGDDVAPPDEGGEGDKDQDGDDEGYGPHGVLRLTLERSSPSLPWRVALKTSPSTGDVVAFPAPRGFGSGDEGGLDGVIMPLRDEDVISSIHIVDSVPESHGPNMLTRPEVSSVGGVTVVDLATASAWLDLVAGAFKRAVVMELEVVRPPPPPTPPPPESEDEDEEEETDEEQSDEEEEEKEQVKKKTYSGGRRLKTPKKARRKRKKSEDDDEEGSDGEEEAYVPPGGEEGASAGVGRRKRKPRGSSAKKATTPRAKKAKAKTTPKKRTPTTPRPPTRRVHTLTLRRASKSEPWGVELKSASGTGDVIVFPPVPYPRGRGAPGKLHQGDVVASIRILEGDDVDDGGGEGGKKGSKGKGKKKGRGRPKKKQPTTLTRPSDIVLGDGGDGEAAEAWLDEVADAFGRSTLMEVEVLRAATPRPGSTPPATATTPQRKSAAMRLRELEEGSGRTPTTPRGAKTTTRGARTTTSGRKRKVDQDGNKGRRKVPRVHKKVTWEHRLEQLKAYKEEHGHCNVGKGRTTDDGEDVDDEMISLANWVSYQRWQYRRYLRSKVAGGGKDGGGENDDGADEDEDAGPASSPSSRSPRKSSNGITMTEERIEALEKIGFEWQTPPEFSHRARRVDWDDRLEELRRYVEEHGNCNVPQGHPTGLGKWVHNQRSNYKIMLRKRAREEDEEGLNEDEAVDRRYTTMTDERVAALDELGFQWRQVVRTDWDVRFRELLDYKEEHGNVDVPMRYAPNPSLASWVMMQRRMRGQLMAGEKPETSGMTHERAARLEEIGFKWRLKPVRQSVGWNERLADLRRYHERFGDCKVPQKWEENISLGKWVGKIRAQYKMRQEGKPTPLTDEMAEELDKLDFGETVGINRVHWSVRVAELAEYKRRFGNCDVPIKWKENRKLGKWVGYARQGYRLREAGKPTYLPDEAIEELNKLGFKWRGRNLKEKSKQEKENKDAPTSKSNEV